MPTSSCQYFLHFVILFLLKSSLPGEVLWRQKLPDDLPGHYDRWKVAIQVKGNNRPTEKQLQEWKLSDSVEKIELIGGELIITRYKDLWKIAEFKKWQERTIKRLSTGITQVGHFRLLDTLAGKGPGAAIFFDEPGDWVGGITEQFRGPGITRVEVSIKEVREKSIDTHQFLRRIIKYPCRVVKFKGSWIVLAEFKGVIPLAAWLSGEHYAIYLASVNTSVKALIPLYLERFPSTLTRKLKVNKTAWGRKEMNTWLRRMANAVKTGDKGDVRHRFSYYLSVMKRHIFVPWALTVTMHKSSLGEKRQFHGQLVQWWEDNREKTYWHDGMRMLVAKGQTPEELAEIARKRQEAKTQAALDAPISEQMEARIFKLLIATFEKEMKESIEVNIKAFGEKSGAKFYRVEEGKWEWQARQSLPGALYRYTYTGPEVSKSRDKKYPRVGVFQYSYYDHFSRKNKRLERKYYYDKLRGVWVKYKPY